MPFLNFKEGRRVRIWEGINGTLHHSDHLTCGYIILDEGVLLPEHQHVQEQWTHVIEGTLEFRIGNETKVLTPGMCAYIPSIIPHAGKAITACTAIDVFNPVREDFKSLEADQFSGK